MTKNLAQKLIDHYEMVIDLIKKTDDIFIIKGILINYHVLKGICYCSKALFDENLISDNWVNSFGRLYWFDTPFFSSPKKEIIHLLQLRVNRLKTFKDDK